jgi:hypothetical protein
MLCAISLFGAFFVGCRSPEHNAEAPSPEPAPARNASGTVTDIDGNLYRTVTIGAQTWMAENLRVTRDPGGRPITSYCCDDDPADAQSGAPSCSDGTAFRG